jgi:large subunit ribosomal protein L25
MTQDTISLELEPREILGKSVKHIRKEGKTPAVIHNHGKDSIVVQGDSVAMLKVYRLAGKHHPVEVKAAGKTFTTIIKSAEFEPRKNRLNHIVFNAVAADQKVATDVPLEPMYDEGNDSSPAERAGLLVLSTMETVEVEALPSQLPDVIYYNAEVLAEVGDHIQIKDLLIPEGVTVLDEPNKTIASVFEPSAVAAANEDAGGDAEPEEPEAVEGEEGEVAEGEAAAGEEEAAPEAESKNESPKA